MAKPFVFVLMPFDASFDDEYKLGIKPACADAGARCARVDEQIFLQSILDRIYGEIRRADLIVAEMSGRNPNVFYEAGFAHGLGKPVVLLTRSADDIPFDLRHYPHIIHGGSISTLKPQLEKRIKYLLENPTEAVSTVLSEAERMAKHITNYMKANDFTMVSFARIRERINHSYTDAILLKLIEHAPDRFRRVAIKGGQPGIGLVNE